MKKQFFTVKDIVQITGVTTRTLHYYDKIGLLKPTRLAENGYRTYSRKDLENLQTILFFKEMDLNLYEISDIMKLSKEEQKNLLQKHCETLLLKQQRLTTIINSLGDYVAGKDISNLNIFNNSPFLPLQEQYDREAKITYGQTEKYKEFEKNLEKLSHDEKTDLYNEFSNSMENVFKKLAKHIQSLPSSHEVQELIEEWKSLLEKSMTCDKEILECIADNYKNDNRFKNYLNQFSNEDLSDFIYQAIMYYCKTIKNKGDL